MSRSWIRHQRGQFLSPARRFEPPAGTFLPGLPFISCVCSATALHLTLHLKSSFSAMLTRVLAPLHLFHPAGRVAPIGLALLLDLGSAFLLPPWCPCTPWFLSFGLCQILLP